MADPSTPPKTIGDEISLFETKVHVASAAADAAAQADRQMADTAADRDTEEGVLTGALKKTGPITKANGDGTFSTYRTSTSAAGDRLVEETTRGVDTPLDAAAPVSDPLPPPPADATPLGPDQPSTPEPADPNAPVGETEHEPIVVTNR
jgi:hypothetical protein